MLDWLAFYEVEPWGEARKDLRSAVQSLHNRGIDFDRLPMMWPYHEQTDDDEVDEADIIAEIEAEQAREKDTAVNAPA